MNDIDEILDDYRDSLLGSGFTGHDSDGTEALATAKAAIERYVLEARIKDSERFADFVKDPAMTKMNLLRIVALENRKLKAALNKELDKDKK